MKSWISGPGGRIARIYRSVAFESRTRRVRLLGRKCLPTIQKTFLGYELLMGRTRLNCPDLPTARYLAVFAEIGCEDIALPYDPTVTAAIVPELEKAASDLKDEEGEPARLRRLYRRIRQELKNLESARPA